MKNDRSNSNGGFSIDDILNVEAILTKFRDEASPLMTHLASKLSKAGQAMLVESLDPAVNWTKLKQPLAQELSELIGRGAIYDKELFAGVKLRKSTKRHLSKKSQAPAPAHAQRLLIEDVFPKEIARRLGRGKNAIQKPAKVLYVPSSDKWTVFVTLVKPRKLEGQMRSGRQKFERQTEVLANILCAEINNQLLDKELARELSRREIEIAKKLFWEFLEPKHPDWIDHLDKLIGHCETTDFRIEDKTIPTISEAAKIFWKEYLSTVEYETMMSYRNALAYLLPAFGSNKACEMTDKQILVLAYGKEPLPFLKTNVRRGISPEEAEKRLWDTPMVSRSKRPWSHDMLDRFLKCIRAFKNWMHCSKDPLTQQKRDWCLPSKIELPEKPTTAAQSRPQSKQDADNALNEECRKNPALTILQAQAILDVAWVAYDGEFAPFYVHGLFCGSRVKETKKTVPAAFDSNDGMLTIPSNTAKTGQARDSELYPNAIVMVEALRSSGLYTAGGFRPNQKRRAVIHILAGFTATDKESLYAAELERKRLAKLGIILPRHNWGIAYPKNALRRTALSMHYKLFLNVALTTGWGGNSGKIFREFYKRLVSKEAAKKYWVMLPIWLTKRLEIKLELPPGHKLDSAMTKKVASAVAAASSAMTSFRREIADAKKDLAEAEPKVGSAKQKSKQQVK